MRYTTFAGLTDLDSGDPISTDGSSFTTRSPEIIDQWLSQIVAIRHTGAEPIANPASAPEVTVSSTGGGIPTGTSAWFAYTTIDAGGGETAQSPVTNATTPAGIGAPASAASGTVDYSAGTLMIATFQYVFTITDETGGESEMSPVLTLDRVPGPASARVLINGLSAAVAMAGGAGWRMYKATNGTQYALAGAGNSADDTFTDAGGISLDYSTQPPTSDTTNQTGSFTVTVPASGGVAFKLYASDQDSFFSPALYGTFPIASAGMPIVVGNLGALLFGSPPPVSNATRGAPMIDPDTELLDWHWKRPVDQTTDLPAGEQGDVRLVYGASAIYGVLGNVAEGPSDWTELVNPGGGGGGSASIAFRGSGGIGITVNTVGDTIEVTVGFDDDLLVDPAAIAALEAASGTQAVTLSELGAEIVILGGASGAQAAEIAALAAASAGVLVTVSALVADEVALALASGLAGDEITTLISEEVALAIASGLAGSEIGALAAASAMQAAEIAILELASGSQAAELTALMAASAFASAVIAFNTTLTYGLMAASASSSAAIASHQLLQDAEIAALAAASASVAAALVAIDADLGDLAFLDGEVAALMPEVAALMAASGVAHAELVILMAASAGGGGGGISGIEASAVNGSANRVTDLLFQGSGGASASVRDLGGGSAIVTIVTVPIEDRFQGDFASGAMYGSAVPASASVQPNILRVAKFELTGDGGTTAWLLAHNLRTTIINVTAQGGGGGAGFGPADPYWSPSDANHVTVSFAGVVPAGTSYVVMVTG